MPPKAAVDSGRRDNTNPSCAVCNRRKVKCDRVYPCGPCRKTGLDCAFPEPSKKRARRKPPTPPPEPISAGRRESDENYARASTSTIDGLRSGSEGAKQVHVGVGAVHAHDSPPSDVQDGTTSAAYQSPNLLFGSRPKTVHVPTPISMTEALTIRNMFKLHVDPVTKVFLCPDGFACLEQDEAWASESIDLDKTPDLCLFRGVCFVTAVATEGSDLWESFQCRGPGLTQRFRADAEAALSDADFVRTRHVRTLQGLVLYLIALQSLGEDETVWSMLGMAIRTASVLGLPQDIGEDAQSNGTHSPYHLEMRRRVWWAIIALDARVTRILGRTGYLSHNFSDVPKPANVNDNGIIPSMTEIPEDNQGLSDSVYVRYRATLSDLLPFIYASGNAQDKCTGLMEMIDEAERQIEDQFIRHCDQSIPLHLLTFIAGRGYIKRVKLAMYSIYPTPSSPAEATQIPYAAEAFTLAKDSMESFLLTWTDPGLRPWQWHWKDFFGWHTLRILIQEIAKRDSNSEETIEAWRLVKQIAALLVSALKLGEEKARLVGDLRMLIEAADMRRGGDGGFVGRGEMVRSVRPGMGTNPFNAMFPGMGGGFAAVDAGPREGGEEDVNVFHLKGVNWVEIDRVLVLLGKYSGG